MYSIPVIVTLSLAALFGIIGGVQLAGPRFLRDAYRRRDYPSYLRPVTGLLDVAAAVMLTEPTLRAWGITLAAMLVFGSVIAMLNNRQYVYAALVAPMMAALVPAALTVPRESGIRYIAVTPQTPTDAR